jgi:serine protease inhibitor
MGTEKLTEAEASEKANKTTAELKGKKSKRFKIITIAVIAAAFVAVGLYFIPTLLRAEATASPTYPAKTSFNDVNARRKQNPSDDFMNSLKKFSASSASVVLSNDEGKNMLYSPVSLYYALALSSDGANGKTQSEILNALSMDGIGEQEMNKQSAILFNSIYLDNELGRLKLANSLWLSKDINFNSSFLDNAAKNYYASSFDVDFSSPSTAKKISKWASDNTGGKLGGDITTDPKEVMSLINTVYFYDQWAEAFNAKETKKGSFKAASGSKTCDFMKSGCTGSVVVEKDFNEAALGFKNGEYVLFILPNKGVSPEKIISDKETLARALDFFNNKISLKSYTITYQIPKFSYGASLDLNESLKKLGINSAFDKAADFSNISNSKPFFINSVHQDTHIAIDEKGCEATAYTEIAYAGAAQPNGHVDMILDHPFIYAIMCSNGTPLFVGVVNNPTQK